jgi:hypothetical protein
MTPERKAFYDLVALNRANIKEEYGDEARGES